MKLEDDKYLQSLHEAVTKVPNGYRINTLKLTLSPAFVIIDMLSTLIINRLYSINLF